jgi:hypothetical protein
MSSHLVVQKTNAQLLNDILKAVHSLHRRMDLYNKDLMNVEEKVNIIKHNVIDLNYRLPERENGFFWGGSWKTKG